MKKLLLLALLCFTVNGYPSNKEFICTYKVTFQSNPYDDKTYTEKNPKLLSDWTFVDFFISQQEIFFHHEEDLISNLPLEIKISLLGMPHWQQGNVRPAVHGQ